MWCFRVSLAARRSIRITRSIPGRSKLAEAALAELKISHLADRPVCEMSSGEARRVLIARALVHKPRALLFDEPCNSLDLVAQQKVRHTMSALADRVRRSCW